MDFITITIFAPKQQNFSMYYKRIIDDCLTEWASRQEHKPLLLRGARQVGKSTAVRHLGEKFKYYVEVNFEKYPEYKALFQENLDVGRIVPLMSAMSGKPIEADNTLLFLDEVQDCTEAIMSLRFFKEDMPGLHVIAAGSLLELALEELPTFGVGRIHSMFMHPMTFDEFIEACGEKLLLCERNKASITRPLPDPLHHRMIQLIRTYMLVGGMPEAVREWNATRDFIKCQEIQDDILVSYEDDFAKYKKKADPVLLRLTLRSAAAQVAKKFVYTQVGSDYKAAEVKKALEMLIRAGLLIPVTRTNADGLPLGSGADSSFRKILVLDPGLMLRLLNMSMGDISQITSHILTSSAADLVNRGPMAELLVGLEMLRYQSPNLRHELFYWTRQARNSQAEVDYLTVHNMNILPVEVKSGTQGGMKSLWSLMHEKNLYEAVRCSLENFGTFDYTDKEAGGAVRHITTCPLYAVSMMTRL